MSGSIGLAVAGDQLVERIALPEFGVELTAEFARVAGARGIETMDKGWINVFHEKYLLGKGRRCLRPFCEAELLSASGCLCLWTTPFYYKDQGV